MTSIKADYQDSLASSHNGHSLESARERLEKSLLYLSDRIRHREERHHDQSSRITALEQALEQAEDEKKKLADQYRHLKEEFSRLAAMTDKITDKEDWALETKNLTDYIKALENQRDHIRHTLDQAIADISDIVHSGEN